MITPGIADDIAATVESCHRLDDTEGGSRAALRHMQQQVTEVTGHIRNSRFSDNATRRRTISVAVRCDSDAQPISMSKDEQVIDRVIEHAVGHP
ncbi:hypothetical protein H7827_27745 [Streptomyces sp. JH002]|uniref:hypothetical protein n=1 Tax=Streptomyces sp. JH002 TaxID=2763259 RepID=UPI003D8043E8